MNKYYPKSHKRVELPNDRAYFDRRARIAKSARRMMEEKNAPDDVEEEPGIPGVDEDMEYPSDD